MARKRVEEVIAEFESWDDVNQALGTIGDNQRMVEGFEAEMQEKIDAAKAEAEAKSRIYLEGTKRLEAQIAQIVDVVAVGGNEGENGAEDAGRADDCEVVRHLTVPR